MKRRKLLQQGSLVLLLGSAQIARGATILAVRVWPAADYTRVTIESDAALSTRQLFVPNPPRLAVDIEGIELNPTLRDIVAKVRSDDPNIAGVRVGQNAPSVVRIVLDLKLAISPQVFTLPPIAAYQHRLVLDLYPVQAIDPLESLIRNRLDSPAPASGKQADPLGDLMQQQAQRPMQPEAKSNSPAPAARPSTTERLIIVAIDPGHGGEDPGAIGPGGTKEKDVVLALARRLREQINASSTQGHVMRAYLIRDADYFVPLHVRVQKARQVQADLFVSIHADAFYTARPQGASVFALSHGGASSSAARWIAAKENKADLIGGINIQSKDKQVMHALLDMSTTAQIKDSLKLGGSLLGEIGKVGKLHKPRVEQAGFAVLKAPDIPSVLVEAGFISNPDEEAKLNNQTYKEQLADALLKGIKAYFAKNPPLARSNKV